MKLRPAVLFAFFLALLSTAALAQPLYVASMRGQAGVGATLLSGLYTVNLGTGTATFAAPLRIGIRPVGITGLSVHPVTGVFFGITSTLSPNYPKYLVTVDPTTGDVSPIGELSLVGTDIVFNNEGRLFIWLPGTRQIGTVDINTGKVTPVGRPGPPDAMGGLAMDPQGRMYITPGGATGALDTVDPATGEIHAGPQLTGAPYPGAITALTFTPSGLLLGVNSNVGSPAATKLVQINTATGVMTTIGVLPDDSDALTFGPTKHDAIEMLRTLGGRTLALLALVAGLVLGLAGMAAFRLFRRDGPQKNTR
jgi:streptogramin lyase